ncbi:hypothetical protein OIO90_004000 [Microbotryomycetes sp. JL221]|nr:hypothetical protein OIO90_004000 [Microbotryomycetes sp. JL221]
MAHHNHSTQWSDEALSDAIVHASSTVAGTVACLLTLKLFPQSDLPPWEVSGHIVHPKVLHDTITTVFVQQELERIIERIDLVLLYGDKWEQGDQNQREDLIQAVEVMYGQFTGLYKIMHEQLTIHPTRHDVPLHHVHAESLNLNSPVSHLCAEIEKRSKAALLGLIDKSCETLSQLPRFANTQLSRRIFADTIKGYDQTGDSFAIHEIGRAAFVTILRLESKGVKAGNNRVQSFKDLFAICRQTAKYESKNVHEFYNQNRRHSHASAHSSEPETLLKTWSRRENMVLLLHVWHLAPVMNPILNNRDSSSDWVLLPTLEDQVQWLGTEKASKAQQEGTHFDWITICTSLAKKHELLNTNEDEVRELLKMAPSERRISTTSVPSLTFSPRSPTGRGPHTFSPSLTRRTAARYGRTSEQLQRTWGH